MLTEIYRKPSELPWQPNLGKNKQKPHNFSSAQKIQYFFTRIVRFSGSANLNMLTEISIEPRELPWQPNLSKSKQKPHRFQFCAKHPVFFTRIVRFSGSAKLNMLSEIFRESRELPWQPNLAKINKNCTEFSSAQKIEYFS